MYKQLPRLISRRHDDEVVYLDFTDRQNEDIVSSSLFLSSSVIHVKRWRCHSHVPVIYYLYRHLFPIACFLVQIMSVLAAVKTSPKEKYRSSTSTRTLRSRDKPVSQSLTALTSGMKLRAAADKGTGPGPCPASPITLSRKQLYVIFNNPDPGWVHSDVSPPSSCSSTTSDYKLVAVLPDLIGETSNKKNNNDINAKN